MRQQRVFAFAFALVILGGHLRAEWRVESSTVQPGAGLVYIEKTVGADGHSRTLRLVLPDPKECGLRVVDNPGGSRTLGAAMEATGCIAGVNGGYFLADHTPLGLVIENGRMIHPLEGGKLITGLVVVSRGRVELLRTGEFKPTSSVTQALQSGPFLIDRSRPVPGLNSTKRAYRTVVFSDGKGGFGLLMAEAVSLAEMAQILAVPSLVPEMKIVRALNLDGGTSSAIWVKSPSVYQREFKRVGNFLGILKRIP